MTSAFHTQFIELGIELKLDPPLLQKDSSPHEISQVCDKWNTFCKSSVNDTKMTDLCYEKDQRAIEALATTFPEMKSCEITQTAWNLINKLNGYSTVTSNIPTKMMGRIEDMAAKLAEDISAGRTSMENLNLSDIGQQVLSGCNQEDMSNFANNIDNLLPALQQFHTKS